MSLYYFVVHYLFFHTEDCKLTSWVQCIVFRFKFSSAVRKHCSSPSPIPHIHRATESSNIQSLSSLLMFPYMIHTHMHKHVFSLWSHMLWLMLSLSCFRSFPRLFLLFPLNLLKPYCQSERSINSKSGMQPSLTHTHTHIPHARIHIHFQCVCACYTLSFSDHPNRPFIENILVWLSIISNICFQLHILRLTKTSIQYYPFLHCFRRSYLKIVCVYRNSRALKRNMSYVCRRLSIHTLSLLKRRTYRSERWADKHAHISTAGNVISRCCRNSFTSLPDTFLI